MISLVNYKVHTRVLKLEKQILLHLLVQTIYLCYQEIKQMLSVQDITMATSHFTPTEVAELFGLLESNSVETVKQIKVLVLGNLTAIKEAWLVNSLVDYYYISHSEEALSILTEIREPHDRHLVEKISEGIKAVEHRLQAFRLLLHIACKQPIWLHKLLSAPVFPAVIKCLKTEADVPVLMTGVMVLTILLPSLPVHMGSHLQEMFDIFSYAVAFSVKKPGNVPEVFLIHLQVALYALFHRLYGMFPYNFLIFLRHFYSKKENFTAYQEFIKPMLERVRLHPHLIDATRESETSQKRWKQMENHDILVECAKMSLDILEGTWEELSCPISPKLKLQTNVRDKSTASDDKLPIDPLQALHSDQQEVSVYTQPIAADSNLLWSPSLLVGLSTPPPSQRTTPATSLLETSSNQYLFQGLSGTPQATPPVVTPAETPPITDESDGKTKKTGKTASLRSSDNRKLSGSSHGEKLHLNILPGSFDGNRSVPPSPLKVNFISEPPRGTLKSQPIKSAVRELQFDFPPSFAEQKIQLPQTKNTKDGIKAADVDSGSHSGEMEATTSYHISPESNKMTMTTGSTNPPQVSDGVVTSDKNPVSTGELTSTEQESDLMESFSMDTLPKVIEKLNSDDEETMDKEVSDLTQAEQPVYLTAESVQKFMRSVNRIRFNSMTASNNIRSHFKNERGFGGQGRSRSCPQLPKGTPEEEEDTEEEQVSRSVSKPDFVNHSVELNKIESLEEPENLQETKNTDDNPVDMQTSSVTDGHTSGQAVSTCPVLKEQDVKTGVKEGKLSTKAGNSGILDLLRHFLMPANISVCHNCKQQMIEADEKSAAGRELAMFSVLSPMELLDQYFKLGSQVHAKELSKIPMTSQESINWTHFGGMPPPDEINILRGQLFMMENQILYERNKREMHAKRNRRLLRRITHANALEEQNKAQADQIQILTTEIKNLQVSLKLLQAENQSLKEKQESNENETRVTLSACLIEKEDLKSAKAELNTLLVRQREEQDKLQQKLQTTESTLFDREQKIVHLKQEVETTQKLKEQVLQLHQELLLMGELQQKYQEKLNMLKLDNQIRPEQELMMNTMRDENKGLRSKLDKYRAEAEARHSRIEEMDETLKQKDFAIQDLKMKLEHVKQSHEDEIKAVEDKYNSMVSICQQLQGQMLKLYSKLDEANNPRPSQMRKNVKEAVKEDSSSRSRSGSVPHIHPVVKHPVTPVSSLPLSFSVRNSTTNENTETQTDTESFTVISAQQLPQQQEAEDSMSTTSRESGLSVLQDSRTSTISYTEGEDRSSSSRGSNLGDSGYMGGH